MTLPFNNADSNFAVGRTDVDMSRSAVDRRMRELGQLYRLGMSLRNCRVLGPVEIASEPDDQEKKASQLFGP